ncbi:hypothetical protein J5X84_43740 [Streptosporangiaceae bacterium NEAU-GS5]|nr:hypothetical protein [Streptosporangiaceae bacterium NEAU-GS5]
MPSVRRFGPNELPRPRRRRIWLRLTAQFADLFAIVLLVSSAITFLARALQVPHDAGTLLLAVAILAIVVLNAVIGFAQEYSAERTAEAPQAMVPHSRHVPRDGKRVEVPARQFLDFQCRLLSCRGRPPRRRTSPARGCA